MSAWPDAEAADEGWGERPKTRARTLQDLFLHGLLFTFIFAGVEIGWTFVLAFLFAIGLWLGVILGIGMLVYLVGWINAAITRWLWFPVRGGTLTNLLHGLLVMVAFALIGLVPVVLFASAAVIPTMVAVILVLPPVYGYVGRRVAAIWRDLPTNDLQSSGEEV